MKVGLMVIPGVADRPLSGSRPHMLLDGLVPAP